MSEQEFHQPMTGVNFHIPPADYDLLKAISKECGVSISQFCRDAVKAYMEPLKDEADPFLAAHPSMSAHRPSAKQSDPDDVHPTFRQVRDAVKAYTEPLK